MVPFKGGIMKSKKHLFFWSCSVDIFNSKLNAYIRYNATGETQQEAEKSLNTQLIQGGVLCNL